MQLLFRPIPQLQQFINKIVLVRYQLDKTKPKPTYPFPPQAEQCLYFYPADTIASFNHADQSYGENPRSMLVGPQLTRVDLTLGYNHLVIIVCFQPGGMHRLLSVPMKEMMDRSFDATLFLGSEIDSVSQRLSETIDDNRMIEIVQAYLLKKASGLKRALPIDQVLMQSNGNLDNIDQLAKHACVSIRQLERQFIERIGMSPKVFARLVRFSKAWRMREKATDLSWLSIAHSCGYADQMHMIRDFKNFAGVTPTILQADLEKGPLRLQRDFNS